MCLQLICNKKIQITSNSLKGWIQYDNTWRSVWSAFEVDLSLFVHKIIEGFLRYLNVACRRVLLIQSLNNQQDIVMLTNHFHSLLASLLLF